MIAFNPAADVVRAADPDRSVEKLELEITSRTYTAEYLTRDSDGDGWSDWHERLEGTDPNDPSSHPGSVHLDIAHLDGATTVFVQSKAFPDRLVALDGLTLPERVDSVGQLLELVSTITGQTTLGKFSDELDASVKEIGGDALASILADVPAHHGSVDIAMGGRTGGQLTVLISVETSNFRFWGDNDGLHTQNTEAKVDDSGSGIVYIEHSVNGSRVTMTHKHYWKGTHTGSVVYDANGNVIDRSIVPLSDVPTTVAVTTATTVAPTTSNTTPETTTVPTTPASTTATTTKGDYVNPDDDSALWRTPTPSEIEARVAFLIGVRARFGGVLDVPKELNPDKPGVHDPAEPPCSDDRCIAFAEVVAPDLSRQSGGCPPTNCTPGRP